LQPDSHAPDVTGPQGRFRTGGLARPLSSGRRRRCAVVHRRSPLLRDPSACDYSAQPVEQTTAFGANMPRHGYRHRRCSGNL
jgi:hypothetical protein